MTSFSMTSPPLPSLPTQIQPMLGTELWECINWRIGALMYMYVHEMMASDTRRTTVDNDFIRGVYNIECNILWVV